MTHGSYTSYVKASCRCAECTRQMREYKAEWTRNKKQSRGQISTAHLTDIPERRVTGISGMTGSSVNNASGVRVWCRCGNSGYANKWIVGKSRKLDHCAECS